LGPADVDFGAIQVLKTSLGNLLVLERPSGHDRKKLYVSSDGERWRRATTEEESAMGDLIVVSGSSSSHDLYRTIESDSVLERSRDGGRNWARAALHFRNREGVGAEKPRLALIGIDGLTLYARVWTGLPNSHYKPWPGVYISDDGGNNWEFFSDNLIPGSGVTRLGEAVLGEGKDGLIQLKNGASEWAPAELGRQLPMGLLLGDRRVRDLLIYQMEFPKGDDESALFVTNAGLFITHGRGKRWCMVTFDSKTMFTVLTVAIASSDGSHIFATTADPRGPRLWESSDRGESFRPVSLPDGGR